MKKKNDKKVLHLTKWMLRITTPLLLLLMFDNLFLSHGSKSQLWSLT